MRGVHVDLAIVRGDGQARSVLGIVDIADPVIGILSEMTSIRSLFPDRCNNNKLDRSSLGCFKVKLFKASPLRRPVSPGITSSWSKNIVRSSALKKACAITHLSLVFQR